MKSEEGWDIALNFDEKCIELCYTDEDGKTQMWNHCPRQALVLAQFLVEKANTLLDMGTNWEWEDEPPKKS